MDCREAVSSTGGISQLIAEIFMSEKKRTVILLLLIVVGIGTILWVRGQYEHNFLNFFQQP